MRVLQVITDTDRRGAQVFAWDLGVELSKRGHHVTTVALADGRTPSPLVVQTLGSTPRSLGAVRALRQLADAHDICIAHGSDTLLACARSGRSFVYRQISDTRFWAATWSRRLRVAAFLRRARHVVALSEISAQALHGHVWLPRERITTIPNAVSAVAFEPSSGERRSAARALLGLQESDFVVLSMGALASEKGVETAIRAVEGVPGLCLLVVGSGPDEHRLRQLAGPEVRFLPATRDPAAMYSAADAFVLPSISEAMPATLIEAGMCGLPCVATPVGSVSEVVTPEVTGLLVPVGDASALRAALLRLRDNPAFTQQLGEAAREHCLQHFDIAAVAVRWEAVLERAAASRSHSRR